MALMLKTQRDGTLRECWYGVYTDADGSRKVVNLGVKVQGNPPASRRVAEPGDEDFEESRKLALKALEGHAEEARHKGRAEHLTERLIEAKTGRVVEYTRIAELPDRWRNMGREVAAGEGHLGNCDAHFRRFTTFMQQRSADATFLYQVTPTDAAAFVKELRAKLARGTSQYGIRLISKAMSRFLPVGAANPFSDFVGRRTAGVDGTVHRKPFTPDELRSLLEVARGDEFMYPLIVTAACTGMRRGDVCRLRWADVDLAGGMLTAKASKTGAQVEIPIFSPLRAVLEHRKRDKTGLVFPEAAALLRTQPRSLTWRFKKLVAMAFEGDLQADPPPRVAAAELEEEGRSAIMERFPDGPRRDRMLDVWRRYCGGQSVRQIKLLAGYSKPTVSADLHFVQDATGKNFMPEAQGPGLTAAVARITRARRAHGQKSASIRDWPSLRTTFVTLALTAGVPMELVRRVTGHKTVEVVLQNYFRPDREHFRAVLGDALPGILTGKVAQTKPADELAALAAKAAAGTATEADKGRMRDLVARM